MKIIALEFYKNGEMKESFALGGSLSAEQIDPNKKYSASLQNYLIDTGNEVILIDTGLPIETPAFEKKEDQPLYMGEKVADFLQALESVGYKPEQVDKIIVTHKHPDHSGELRRFPNAKVYISRKEAESMKLEGEHIIPVDFKDGAFENFEQSEIISENLVMIPAYGHTTGNSLAILKKDEIYYLFHGDVTYTDEALRRKQLSVVFEDKEMAWDTLEKVRTFVEQNPTVYLSTHTPEALTSLAANQVFSF
jgi:Zn-dependent hydrolases, including glyoxylases